MSRADDIRAQAEADAQVADLEDQLLAAKADDSVTAEHKHELRYARWVQRGGPAPDPADDNRATAELRARWLTEQEG